MSQSDENEKALNRLMDEIWGCVEYLKIPFDTLWEMPVYLRKYWIIRHNEKVKKEENQQINNGNGSVKTINGDGVNAYAKLEQMKASRIK